ncbi:MAG: hypothetical protein EHM61_16010, partial [Acidobacteria bacterium]
MRFELPAKTSSAGTGAPLLWDRTNGRQTPVQMTPRPDGGVDVLLVVAQPAHTKVEYRLYYGSPKPGPARSESLRVGGEDLAWQVENAHFIVDFSKNPGTGRSGQINRIFVKRPGIWLSRERDQSTLHLSPNAAGRDHYLPVNRWDPPESWTADVRPLSFRLERSGPMPRLPQLHARVAYEVYADSALILVEEEIEARQTVDLTLLRVGELTFAPDPKNPFTNLVWGNGGQASEAGRNESPELAVDVDWLGFAHRPANYGFISIVTSLATSAPGGGPALLLNPAARFSGTPAHYFWRALITNNSSERGPAVEIPAGSRYRLRYWLYWLEPGNAEPLKALLDIAKAVKNPLRVELKSDGTGPFGVRRQKECDDLSAGAGPTRRSASRAKEVAADRGVPWERRRFACAGARGVPPRSSRQHDRLCSQPERGGTPLAPAQARRLRSQGTPRSADSRPSAFSRSLRSAGSQSGVAGRPAKASDSFCRRTPKRAAFRERENALRALHWLGRDFSFLVPGEDGAALRAVAHELELFEQEGSSSEFDEVLRKAETVLRKHNLATRMHLSAFEQPAVPQTLSLDLGCGPSPVVLEIDSFGPGAQIASRDVKLGPARSQAEEIRLEPAGATWLVLKVSGRPEGGESKRLTLRMGDKLGELWLRSSETRLSTVRVSFHDQVTGRKTPAAVRLYAANGRLVVPAGSLDFGKLGFLYEEDRPVHYADWSSARVRSLDPHFGSSFFRSRPVPESACFYVDGELTARLPPGSYRMTATRGLEYKPSCLVMNISPGKPFRTRINLERWTDMAALGWYSGDGHVHAERATPGVNELIAAWASAEDVAFCNVLLMGDEERTYYPQYAFGAEGRYIDRGTVLAPGQEDPRTAELGHTLHLNLAAPVRFPDRYADYV